MKLRMKKENFELLLVGVGLVLGTLLRVVLG